MTEFPLDLDKKIKDLKREFLQFHDESEGASLAFIFNGNVIPDELTLRKVGFNPKINKLISIISELSVNKPQQINPKYEILEDYYNNFEIKTPSLEELSGWISRHFSERGGKNLLDFIDFFSICPVCKEKNETIYLLEFYLDKSPESVKIKRSLERLRKLFKDNIKKLNIGIPCCECQIEMFGDYDKKLSILYPQFYSFML